MTIDRGPFVRARKRCSGQIGIVRPSGPARPLRPLRSCGSCARKQARDSMWSKATERVSP
eukprot:scaffold109221_cov32-Tisochrysis_lutea.AAC.5